MTAASADVVELLGELHGAGGATIDGEPVAVEGRAATVRPYDDSDPAMQEIAQSLRRPCPTAPFKRCEDAIQEYAGGGDRLARYYIRQWEKGIEEGYKPDFGVLTYMAHTGSPVAFEFLVSLYGLPESDALTRQ